jgi:hypothetical protein
MKRYSFVIYCLVLMTISAAIRGADGAADEDLSHHLAGSAHWSGRTPEPGSRRRSLPTASPEQSRALRPSPAQIQGDFIVDFMSEHGQVFNGNLLPSSADDRNRLLRVFAECLRLAAP